MLFAGWDVCGDAVSGMFCGTPFPQGDVSVDDFCKVGCLEACCLQGSMFVGMLLRRGDVLWDAVFTGEMFQGMILARWDVWRDAVCRVGCLRECCFEGGMFFGTPYSQGKRFGGSFLQGGMFGGMLCAGWDVCGDAVSKEGC